MRHGPARQAAEAGSPLDTQQRPRGFPLSPFEPIVVHSSTTMLPAGRVRFAVEDAQVCATRYTLARYEPCCAWNRDRERDPP